MGELTQAARALAEDKEAHREALEITEESLPLDNEALDLAEGHEPGHPGPEEKW